MKNDTHDSASAMLGRPVAHASRWTARLGLIALAAIAMGAQAQSGATIEEAMANLKATRSTPAKAARTTTRTAAPRLMVEPGGGEEPAKIDPANYFENGKLIRAPKAITAVGNDLFGDRVNLYRGTLEFVQTDVSIEGNNALPVAITRKLTTGSRGNLGQGLFSEWELEIPHMQGIFNAAAGWVRQTSSGTPTNQRCSNFGAPPDGNPIATGQKWRAKEFWQGNFLQVPGGGQQEVLLRDPAFPNNNVPADGVATPLVTTGLWAIRCLGSLASTTASTPTQEQGEGFLAISPDGTRYRFDWLVTRSQPGLTKVVSAAGSHLSIALQEVHIYPTLITDRFGNTVSYTYDTADKWKVLSIQSSDGRSLSFTYEPGSRRIKTATDGTRTWTYNYADYLFPNRMVDWRSLASVTNPDGSTWDFSGMHLPFGFQQMSNGIVDIEIEPPEIQENIPTQCDAGAINGLPNPQPYGRMVHPSGAVGRFWLTPTEHGRNGVPEGCISEGYANSVGKAIKSRFSSVYALTKKEIWGPGLPTMTWQYSYDTWYPGWQSCGVCTGQVATVLVTDPEGDITRHTFGNTFQVNEGQPLKVETGWNGSTALRTTDTRYNNSFGPVGISEQDVGDGGITTRPTPVDRRITTQQDTTFTYLVNSFDGAARPTNVTRSSSLGYSRTEVTTYSDHLSKWVLGQVATVTTNGLISVSNVYDPNTATLTSATKFGVLQNSYTYRADGTLETRKDGRNNTTSFGLFKRGIPQSVGLPTGANRSAVIDDIGRITSVTDEMNITTSYGYDLQGRLTSVTPPAGWTPTTISYVQSGEVEFGLGIGHWRVIETTGNAVNASYLDAFWRPVFTRGYDASDVNNTLKEVLKGYDSEGKVTFESYPKRFMSGVADTPPGKSTFYDALGRPIRAEAASELGVLNTSVEYLAGFQTRSTNARGKQSTQSFWVLDNLDQAQLAGIAIPAGAGIPGGMQVAIARDTFGKPTSITRSGNGVTVTRSYVYDPEQRLCKAIDPEVGATVQDYDGAGNLAWRAPGQDLPGTGCDRASVTSAGKISHTYDELNRLKSTSYGDGHPGVDRTYWADGRLKTITTGDGTAWSYDYNTLRLPTTETLTYGTKTSSATWSYNANGHVSGVSYPAGGPSVSYSPNALGEPTQVSGYASGVLFHPNGAVASYVLANGIAHTQTQNIRGLPERNLDAGVTDDRYAYDQNGNVSAIIDQLGNPNEIDFTRAMTYDDLDRLSTTTALNAWGSATYTYDAVDNIRTAVVGSRSSTMSYDVRNRLDGVTTNGTLSSYEYDARGNVKKKGGQTFAFDLGNRMYGAAPGGSYVYDGHGRRAFINASDGTTRLQMYSQAGLLLWGDRTQTIPTVPATITGYTCSAGTVSGSLCISTSVYNASVTGYQCNPGDSLSGTTCTHTTSSTYGASVGSYVCNAGDSLSGSTCSHSTVNTYGATPVYACNAGDSLSGTTCSHTSSAPATPVYTCPSGWSLNGTTCTTSTSTGATENPNCNGLGAPSIFTGFYACRGDAAVEQFGEEDPADVCMQNYGGFGLQYETYQRKTNKLVSCVFRALVTYSCPAGTTLNGTQCTGSTSQAATIGSYMCPSGSLSGSSCLTTSTYGASVSSYFCNAGDGLSGSTCSHTTTSTYGAAPIYVCNPGDSLSGQTCTSVSGSTYAASPSGYACNSGDALSGATCTHTTQSAATPVYSCSSGTLSGTSCVGGTTTSTTAYIYLGKKQIAETTGGTTQFAHADALGSPVAHTNAAKVVLNRTRYEPYGFTAQGTKPSPATSVIGFTGHVNDADTDLVYMQQRYYDPITGRFLSIDPIVTDSTTGKGFGPYVYVDNNPYAKVDPDGRSPIDNVPEANAAGYQWVAPLAGLRDVFRDARIGAGAAVISTALKISDMKASDLAERSSSVKATGVYGVLEVSFSKSLFDQNDLGTVFVGLRSTAGAMIQVSGEDTFKVGTMQGLTLKTSAGIGYGGIGGVTANAGISVSPTSAGAQAGWGLAGKGPNGFAFGVNPPNVALGLTVRIRKEDVTGSHIKRTVIEPVKGK